MFKLHPTLLNCMNRLYNWHWWLMKVYYHRNNNLLYFMEDGFTKAKFELWYYNSQPMFKLIWFYIPDTMWYHKLVSHNCQLGESINWQQLKILLEAKL